MGPVQQDPDRPEHLLAKARAGDREALAELFARYRDRLRAMVHLRLDRRLQGRIDPSDVLQEACLDLVRRFDEYAANPTFAQAARASACAATPPRSAIWASAETAGASSSTARRFPSGSRIGDPPGVDTSAGLEHEIHTWIAAARPHSPPRHRQQHRLQSGRRPSAVNG
jgi:hypothetical protein